MIHLSLGEPSRLRVLNVNLLFASTVKLATPPKHNLPVVVDKLCGSREGGTGEKTELLISVDVVQNMTLGTRQLRDISGWALRGR